MKEFKYSIGYVAPLVTFMALYFGGTLSFLAPVVMFVCIPLLEMFMPGTTKNYTEEEEKRKKSKKIYDYILYLNVPMQYGLLIFFLFRITSGELLLYEIIGMIFSMGMACGVMGINVAHELGHRVNNFERFLAKSLLLTSLYMHFYIEHNRGHHKNVATPLDPATARFGENVYLFWVRSIVNSYRSAWRIEHKRMKKKGYPLISLHNEMLRFHFIQIGFVVAIGLIFGWIGLFGFLGAALLGYLLLETVNYIEHYGLQRRETAPGRYERVQPWHSWNSNHQLGRIMLYELTRHSDHHYLASRKYQVLRHFDDSPQLPTGYPGMMTLSLVPPLWFSVMNPKVQALQGKTAELAAA